MKLLFYAVAATLLLGMQSTAGAAPGDGVYTRPGRIVPASDGARLNLYCIGSGSATVVFDSGWEDWAPAWAVVQPKVAKWARACSYDRAGAGFSSPGPRPRTSVRIASELHSALHNAGIKGPYILVGNAFGGDPARTFADLYTSELAGLVLVEADTSDVEPKAMQEERSPRQRPVCGAAWKVLQRRRRGDAVAAAYPRPGQLHRTCAQQFFRGLPEAKWSPELKREAITDRADKGRDVRRIYFRNGGNGVG